MSMRFGAGASIAMTIADGRAVSRLLRCATSLTICGAMNLRTLWDDLREIPLFIRMAAALRRASDEGRETLGVLVREQADRIPDRVLLRFENETLTYAAFNGGVNAFAAVFK